MPQKNWGAHVPINANREPPIEYLAFEIQSGPSIAYELWLGTSLAIAGQLKAENNCYLSHYYIASYYYTNISYRIIKMV